MMMASTSGSGLGSGSASESVITPEEVLESLMKDGTIDAIRLKIINNLKGNVELKNKTMSMLEQSKVLNTPGAEKHTKRELFDALRQELETPALHNASKSVWDLIMGGAIAQQINHTVDAVFCRLSGCQPPLFPPPKQALTPTPPNKRKHPSPPSVPNSRTMSTDRGNGMEKEPGRCRRTDGKNWRCTKDRVPDGKYCERHMSKLKKPKNGVENTNQGTLSNIMVDSSRNKSSSTPSQLDSNKNNKRISRRKSNVSSELGSSPKSALKSDTCAEEELVTS